MPPENFDLLPLNPLTQFLLFGIMAFALTWAVLSLLLMLVRRFRR